LWRSGAVRIGRIGGIAVEIHLSFALVIAWGAWQGWVRYGGLNGLAFGTLTVVLLFASVLIHELGHGLQARAFGLVVRHITLLPIGGVAQLETSPSRPGQELLIALAGPTANLGMAVALGSIAYLIRPFSLQEWPGYLLFLMPPGPLAALLYVFAVNLVLFFFNMLPAFPMDGGRIVRGALAMITDYETGTRLAAWVGRIAALACVGYVAAGWFLPQIAFSPLLLLLAVVVYFGARQEELHVRRRRALVRIDAIDVVHRLDRVAAPRDRLAPLLSSFNSIGVMPVVRDGYVVGLLTRDDARRASRRHATVAHAMQIDFPAIKPGETLWVALQEMAAFQLDAIPVIDGRGEFYGMVTLDDVDHAWQRARRS
jgi:Zn-dependent protease